MNPGAVECEYRTKCSQIDSANTMVKEDSHEGVDDVQYNRKEQECGHQEDVGRNVTKYYHRVQYVV
jgi:hypothetical protein